MSGIDAYWTPNDPHAIPVITPQPEQTLRIKIPPTHTAGPSKEMDGCIEIRPKETP